VALMYGGTQKAASTWIFGILQASGVPAAKNKEWHYWDRALGMRPRQRPKPPAGAPGITVAAFLESMAPAVPAATDVVRLRDLPPLRFGRHWPGHRRELVRNIRHLSGPSSALDQWASWMRCWKVGDFTPSNVVLTPPQWEEIALALPDLHVIASVRNPTERVWSALRMYRRQGRVTGTFTAEDALRFATTPGHRERSRVSETVEALRSLLSDDRLFVTSLDDVSARPKETIGRLSEFVGHRLVSPPTSVGRTPEPMPEEVAHALDAHFADEKARLEALVGHELVT